MARPDQIETMLLRAITADPEDDLARLAYADYIEEYGQTERAEFIRLQIERYRRSATDQNAKGISWREYELLRDYEDNWREVLPARLRPGASFRRGFIHHLRCSLRDLIEGTRQQLLEEPIEILDVIVDSLDPEWLAYHPPPLTLPLSEISVHCQLSVGPMLMLALIRYGPFPRLKRLSIRDREMGDEALEALQAVPTFPELYELDISHCGITDRGADELLFADWASKLRLLRLHGNSISAGKVQQLRKRFGNALFI